MTIPFIPLTSKSSNQQQQQQNSSSISSFSHSPTIFSLNKISCGFTPTSSNKNENENESQMEEQFQWIFKVLLIF